MSFTGKLKAALFYNGIELKVGKSYKWKGTSSGLYTSFSWDCRMKIKDIVDEKIYIKSKDDDEVTEWTIESLSKQNIIIKKVWLI